MITEKGKQWIRDNYGDGWSILNPEGIPWKDLGLTESDRESLTREYESDTRDPKSTIRNSEGKILKKLKGVYTLPLFQVVADRVGANYKPGMFFGRGSEARAACDAILVV